MIFREFDLGLLQLNRNRLGGGIMLIHLYPRLWFLVPTTWCIQWWSKWMYEINMYHV